MAAFRNARALATAAVAAGSLVPIVLSREKRQAWAHCQVLGGSRAPGGSGASGRSAEEAKCRDSLPRARAWRRRGATRQSVRVSCSNACPARVTGCAWWAGGGGVSVSRACARARCLAESSTTRCASRACSRTSAPSKRHRYGQTMCSGRRSLARAVGPPAQSRLARGAQLSLLAAGANARLRWLRADGVRVTAAMAKLTLCLAPSHTLQAQFQLLSTQKDAQSLYVTLILPGRPAVPHTQPPSPNSTAQIASAPRTAHSLS